MFKLNQILSLLIILGACVLNLTACGQTGALYLPEVPAASPRSATTVLPTP